METVGVQKVRSEIILNYTTTSINELSRTNSDKFKLENDLSKLREEIVSMDRNFKTLRSSVQVLSIPKLTELERSAEEMIATKGEHVNEMLVQLNYVNPKQPFGAQPSHVDLREQSRHLISLLHKAQDAFAQLHLALSN